MKRLFISLAIIAVLGGLVIYLLPAPQEEAVASPVAPITFEPTPQIVALGAKIGVSKQNLSVVHAQVGVGGCNPKYFQACYDTHTVFLYPEAFNSGSDPATTLGYEYAHYIWEVTPKNVKASLTPFMDSWYLQHRDLVDRSQGDLIKLEGGFGSEAFEDELHSITCTEVNDSELAAPLLAHCKAFLPNRAALENIY